MVITRKGSLAHASSKEDLCSKSFNRRIAELPSLRYGTVGSNTSKSGPLRVTNHHYDTIPRTKKSIISSSSSDGNFRPRKPPRRVRFALPPGEVDGGCVGGGDAGVGGGGDRARFPLAISHREFSADTQFPPENLRGPFTLPRRSNTNRRRFFQDVDEGPNCRKFDQNSSGFSSPGRFRVSGRRSTLEVESVEVPVAASPGPRCRVHPTGRYVRGTLSPTAATATVPTEAATPGVAGQALLRAARDGDYNTLREVSRRIVLVGMPEGDLDVADSSGRTGLSYIASNGPIDVLEQLLHLTNIDPNKPDNEGNTPLHFAAQAGQVECLSALLGRCKGIEIDARNNLGFTPLMKAALQGRNKCAKILLFAGANPTLRDSGRGLRADQWARFCGRYVCADVIEKHARHRLLERSTSYGNWGGENEIGARVLLGKVIPVPPVPPQQHGLKSKLKKVFRTSSGPSNSDNFSSARLVTQLTSAALCVSSPVLPSVPSVPPVVKSLIRPLTVPRLQITLVSNNNNEEYSNGLSNGCAKQPAVAFEEPPPPPVIKPARTKKKK